AVGRRAAGSGRARAALSPLPRPPALARARATGGARGRGADGAAVRRAVGRPSAPEDGGRRDRGGGRRAGEGGARSRSAALGRVDLAPLARLPEAARRLARSRRPAA